MIVIEGIDSTGKSTLALQVQRWTGYRIQESEGPPYSYEELHHRIGRYSEMDHTIFVRHPCVSQPIYRFKPIDVHPDVLDKFYKLNPVFMYCHPSGPKREHQLKSYDTLEFLADIDRRHDEILQKYERWALKHAHFIYRIGDDIERAASIIGLANL